MRGFTKAAVLLSSTLASASAFVIPDSALVSIGDSKSVVEYSELLHYCHDCPSKLIKIQVPQKL